MDYERMAEQFRGQLEELWNKNKADQLRSQIDDLRHNVDDLTKNYNRLLTTGAAMVTETQRVVTQKTRDGIEEATQNLENQGFAWWMPVAILGAIGLVAWLYRKFAAPSMDGPGQPYTNYSSPQPMSSAEKPFPEQR